jgi:hypothetical protein
MNDTTQVVDAIGQMNLEGNIVPTSWYENIRFPGGKPHIVAITLLADIVYWYRPAVDRDETTGREVNRRKRFAADKLQRSYKSYTDQFGFSKRQVADALKFLARLGVISMEFRTVHTKTGLVLSNVLFIEPDPERLAEITYRKRINGTPSSVQTEEVLHPNVTHPPLECETYTEITTETTSSSSPGSRENDDSQTEKQRDDDGDRVLIDDKAGAPALSSGNSRRGGLPGEDREAPPDRSGNEAARGGQVPAPDDPEMKRVGDVAAATVQTSDGTELADRRKKLIEFGVEPVAAQELATAYSAKMVEAWMRVAQNQRKLANRAGFLVARLRAGEMPPGYREPPAEDVEWEIRF